MYLYTVIPLTKLPRPHIQTPLYFSGELLEIGQLVEISLANRNLPAVILKRTGAESYKQAIRKAPFGLKPIKRSLTSHSIFSKKFLELVVELAEYYYASYGLMLQRMLPPFFSKPTKKLLTALHNLPTLKEPKKNPSPKKILVLSRNRFEEYKKHTTKPGICIVPEYYYISSVKNLSKKNWETLNENITSTKWREIWLSAYKGAISGILGTRSALFTPLKNIQTLIVEGENNTSHVSWDQHPKFDARIAAEMFAKQFSLNLIFGDVLPSIERYFEANKAHWEIKKKAYPNIPVAIVDMRKELKTGNTNILSSHLKDYLKHAKPQEKIFLLISRRGLASALVCRDCGFIPRCPNCDAPYVLHKKSNQLATINYYLICHRCGVKKSSIHICPQCSSYRVKQLGGGTQQVVEAVQKIAPHLKVEQIDSDVAKTQTEQQKIFTAFREGDISVLVGTQLGLKEPFLPKLDFAAAVMLDTITLLPAWQSSERTYALLWRLKHLTRRLLVQTYHPELSPFQEITKNSFEPFFKAELAKRKALGYPPFTQIIRLEYKHLNASTAEREALILKQKLEVQLRALTTTYKLQPTSYKLELLGPAPAYLQKLAGKHRWYILIKWPREPNGAIYNLKIRNELLQIVPADWSIVMDPVDLY